jgi:hypothetical protein
LPELELLFFDLQQALPQDVVLLVDHVALAFEFFNFLALAFA